MRATLLLYEFRRNSRTSGAAKSLCAELVRGSNFNGFHAHSASGYRAQPKESNPDLIRNQSSTRAVSFSSSISISLVNLTGQSLKPIFMEHNQ
jgi:hypothetical protein